MTELRKALLGMKLLRFTYRGGTKPGASRGVVPYGIIFGRMNYLIGADAGTVKPKNWRLDRVDKVKCLETPAARPENFDLAAFANRSFGFFEGPQEEVALGILSQGMDDFRNYRFHPSQTVEDDKDGSVIVRFRASGMPELACHLFVWGYKIEIIEPASLYKQLLTQLRSVLKHHQMKVRKAGIKTRPR